MGNASLCIILTGFLVTGCLGQKEKKSQPKTDDTATEELSNHCAGVICWEPPQSNCSTNDALEVFAPSGYCSGGECSYASRQETCRSGLCDDGACVDTPCHGVTCIDPPEPFCRDADRTSYAPNGYCSNGACEYASKTSTCEYTCESGACVDSPCAEVFCLKPPAPYCEDNANAIVFSPEGRCVVVGSETDCRYEAQRLSCPDGCEGGHCVQNPCDAVHCNTPPARYCDEAVLVLFDPQGVCNENGLCVYAEQRHACIDSCVDAHCGEDDACTRVTCDKPPASYCQDDSVLRVYDRSGWCEDGYCFYDYSDIDCPSGCEEARCKDSPCLGVICDKPPAPYCDGEILVNFWQNGFCNDGSCLYPKQESSCLFGCENAECLTNGDTDTDTDIDTDLDTDVVCDTDCPTVTWIKVIGGSFQMGSTTLAIEQPIHSVTVPTFEMLETEVTVAQYGACVTAGVCTEPLSGGECDNWGLEGRENHPVNQVDWNQAVAFCRWVGGRLPSEAEWEYAASNGHAEDTYPWGDETATCSYAVIAEGGSGCGKNRTWEVCSKTAGNTSNGLCDMAGNVFEWVQDEWHPNYTEAPDDGSAWEDLSAAYRVVRGGSFRWGAAQQKATNREFDHQTVQYDETGIRCAR